jgi:hypothetical protein
MDDILKKRRATCIDKVVTDVDQRDEEELIQSENTKFMKVPAMAFLDIPLKPTIVQLLLREIVLLHNLFPKKNLMQYENWKGKISNSISIPVCSNKKTFIRMNQRKHFIDNIPVCIRGDNTTFTNDDVVGWIVQRFTQCYEDKVIMTLKDLGYIHKSTRMSEEVSQAMWEEANCNSKREQLKFQMDQEERT